MDKKMVLLKDIIIPKGTILGTAPRKSVRIGTGHYGCVVGLSDNTYGDFTYSIDSDSIRELEGLFEQKEPK